MGLPRIPSNNLVSKPAVAERVFPDRFIAALNVSLQSDGKQPCTVALQAYNYETKDMSEDPATVEYFNIPNIWTEAERSPVFAQILGSLVQVIFLSYRERLLRSAIGGMVAGPERDITIVELQSVQSQLQVPPDKIPDPFVESVVWAKPQDPIEPTPFPWE
jgi:hypothetical protein